MQFDNKLSHHLTLQPVKLHNSPPMIPGEVSDILLHAFKKLQPGIWYVVDDTNRFTPYVRKALSLSPFLYNSLLQLSGILTQYGDNFRFNLGNIDTIIVSMQENISITTSRCKFDRDGKKLVCVHVFPLSCPR